MVAWRRGGLLVAVLAALGTGCAHVALRPAQALHDAELLGRAIFEQDRISAIATDAMRAAGGFDTALAKAPAGWTTAQTPAGWRVSFLARAEGQLVVHAQVLFEPASEDEGYAVWPGQRMFITPEPVQLGEWPFTPLEHHVLANLATGLPIGVLADGVPWMVENGKIDRMRRP